MLERISPGALNSFTSPSSICESYKNVDFFAVQEPYTVVKNHSSMSKA